MRTSKVLGILCVLALAAGMIVLSGPASPLMADGCYTCASGSPCHYCRYGSSDTSAARKACEKKGCKITGTGSCPTAANYKVCKKDLNPGAGKVFLSER